ncbi:MAG: cysteine synthase A [Clostridia bacterium]|nr:cysteine synthase A [Clostridia bacterium]
MANIYRSVDELVGKTPLLRLGGLENMLGLRAELYAKLEYFNPTGSIKDRAALFMLDAALREGKISEGATVIEPTSGNTGIGLAAIAAARGLRAVIVMPDTMSGERIALMRAYGAEVVLSPGSEGMRGAIALAEELAEKTENSFIPSQFDNPENALAHYSTTGPEILSDMDGKVDIFVAGVGTGGTLSGAGRYLCEKCPEVKIVAVEPSDSPLLSGGSAAPHGIQGIGANFIPSILDTDIIDEVITVSTEEAYDAIRKCSTAMGIAVGISSGAALCAAIRLARRAENSGKRIAVIFPDGIDRYLSLGIF